MINTLSIFIGNVLAIVIVAILMLNLPSGFTRDRIQAKVFTWFCFPIVLGSVFGIGSAFFDGISGPFAKFMVILCGSMGIIMPVLMSFMFWLYVECTAKRSIRALMFWQQTTKTLLPVLDFLFCSMFCLLS